MNYRPVYFLVLALFPATGFGQALDPGRQYILDWKSFYPAKALDQGMHASIFDREDRSESAINQWLQLNRSLLEQLSQTDHPYVQDYPIDARLLRMQFRREVNLWEKEQPHRHSLRHYTDLITKAIPTVLNADFLDLRDQARLLCHRLESMVQWCANAKNNLRTAPRSDLERGLQDLERSQAYLRNELELAIQKNGIRPACADFAGQLQAADEQIAGLIGFVQSNLLPKATKESSILGREVYAQKLSWYTDSSLSPEQLGKQALEAIDQTRMLMGEVAKDYLQHTYPDQPLPESLEATVKAALKDMEKDAPKNGVEYVAFWKDLSAAAQAFIREQEIATLPEFQTLRILSAPESAGPAARIGWVESAPPFAPNPMTTLYLPSVPDTLPEQERIDFWSSFNKPFNRMIVIHELFPGHYMQIKISRETPHLVRLLFPYGPYFEGWATFAERVCLDKGWEAGKHLTMLAHLRKRLENANRAYTSVMVHCAGWNQEQVMQFSTERSLLAPQFAKSLWGRLMQSPMQITSYFWGGQQFTQLLAAEQERLGDQFVMKDFMDTIMRAGPIPIDAFPVIFQNR